MHDRPTGRLGAQICLHFNFKANYINLSQTVKRPCRRRPDWICHSLSRLSAVFLNQLFISEIAEDSISRQMAIVYQVKGNCISLGLKGLDL
jgi:hypothetical protein